MRSLYKAAIIIIGLSSFRLFGQEQSLSGFVKDGKSGETLPGATILAEGTGKGTVTDIDGRFTLKGLQSGKVNLVVSYISYATLKLPNVAVGRETPIQIDLQPSSADSLQEVTVVTTISKESNVGLTLLQKNNAVVSDGVSAETIKRTPDRNSSDVLKRISGVTVQDDRYVVVRGLNERYNAAYLNGSPLPSTEADKKAFAFDLFPSNMLENIMVYKTATPDMPAEFAGGVIQVTTKGIPERSFLSVSAGTGVQSITTGRDRVIYNGGRLDKLGMDDGSRDLPAGIPSLHDKDTWVTNDEQARVAGMFPNNWDSRKGRFGPQSNFQLSAGHVIRKFGRDYFGVVFSTAYNATYNRYDFLRAEYDGLLVSGESDHISREREYNSTVYQAQYSTGALLNLTWRPAETSTISLKNLLCNASDDRFVSALGTNNLTESDRYMNRVNSRYFSANLIASSQLTGDHEIKRPGIRISWNASASKVKRTVPDLRVMSYSRKEFANGYASQDGLTARDTMFRADVSTSTGPSYSGYRVFSALNESAVNGAASAAKEFRLSSKWKSDVKAGGAYQQRSRTFDMRSFGMNQYSNRAKGIFKDDSLLYLPETEIFSAQNMGVTPAGTGGFKAFENTKEDDNYRAVSHLAAGYAMGEFKHTDKLRIITGLRYENYRQLLTVAYQDKDSVYVANATGDLLPSINVVYNLTNKTAIRTAYYSTLNRPEFRELAKVNWFDPETRLSVAGSPDLVRSYIRNADLRFEHYAGRGQVFSTSLFYKYFVNPIERYMMGGQESQIVYRNANFAHVYGAELEYRVILGALLKKDSSRVLNGLTLFSNLALIRSVVNVAGINDHVNATREMQGQSPYLVNVGASFNDKKSGFGMAMMLNRAGARIFIVGNDQVPDRWENGRTMLDLQFSQSLMKKKLEIRVNIKDILQQDQVIFYKTNPSKKGGYNPSTDLVNFSRNFGTAYGVVISYRF